ncbi:hypothetical protein JJV70_14875 [Streptomyces sp. JJ66]|uniref:hypothetical protein n=1 Tax=Streptomyces sp. JJ66 TaxID=2803843 RepID=UPI001C5681CE|nr:hypothetical protein [Streptomyces sp. JJ66]MBW1603361.1 hypothetical protein [Streptomyces sp. JJ66]
MTRVERDVRARLLDGREPMDVRYAWTPAGAPEPAGPALRACAVLERYAGRRPPRLLVTGATGAGKTVLGVSLVLRLLEQRAPGDPVPVRLPLPHGDDAAGLDPPGVLAGWLRTAYRLPRAAAEELVREGSLVLILDAAPPIPATPPAQLPAQPESGWDARWEAGRDVSPGAERDAGRDIAPDAGPDASRDATQDGRPCAGRGVGQDGGLGAGRGVALDVRPCAGRDVGQDAPPAGEDEARPGVAPDADDAGLPTAPAPRPGPAPAGAALRATLAAFAAHQQAVGAPGTVLLCPADAVLLDAVRAVPGWGEDAARVEVLPLRAEDARSYLRAHATAPDRWRAVCDVLTAAPHGPLAAALNTPARLLETVRAFEVRAESGGYTRHPRDLLTEPLPVTDLAVTRPA